jgi:hypothetical protein
MKFRQPEICRTFLKQLALSNSALPRLASFRQNSGSINHLPCSSSCGQLRRIPAITEVCIKAYCLALILLPILGAGLAAQQPPSDAPRAHIITGELTHAIDAKKAKVGGKVTLRLVDHIYSNGRIIVPYRNGKVIGHITHVRPPTKENPQSMVAIEFDRIEVKGGTALPITAVIQSMTPPDHHMLNHPSGIPTSGDNAAAQAAGPMVEFNGRAVLPDPVPLTQPGPRAAARDEKLSVGKRYAL